MKTSTVLRKARNLLAKNEDELSSRESVKYICDSVGHVLGIYYLSGDWDGSRPSDAACDHFEAITDEIARRIQWEEDVHTWLMFRANVPVEELTDDNVQFFRHRWLTALIAEYKSKGD